MKDLCKMMCCAILTNINGGTYNAGTGVKTTLQEQIDGIISVFSPKDSPSKIIYKPEMPTFTSFVMDIKKAERELNYQPEFSYLEYLEDYKKELKSKRFDSLWK